MQLLVATDFIGFAVLENDRTVERATATIEAIQTILAPAVLISATALFLLGLNARYVALFTRIRHLRDEQRQLEKELARCIEARDRECFLEQERVISVDRQVRRLLKMVWCLRNSILSCILAAAFFVLTSCSIGLDFLIGTHFILTATLYLFMAGILFMLLGIIFLGIDIFISYPVILLETKNHSIE